MLEGFAESNNLDTLMVKLKGTEYAEELSTLSKPYSAKDFEIAFRKRQANIHQALGKVTQKQGLLSSYYLKFMARNLKVILKGMAMGLPNLEISKYIDIYAEELVGKRDIIVRTLATDSLDQAIDVLKRSEFSKEAKAALEVFKNSGKAQIFDLFIDKSYYQKISGAFNLEHKGDIRVRDIVAVDIDSYNSLAVLRGLMWHLDPVEVKELLVSPFFDVSESCLNNMINAENVTESLKILGKTTYRKVIPLGELTETRLPKLEDAFRVLGYQRAANPFLWDIMKTSVALGAVKLSELEVRNLSAITFGVEHHLDFGTIMGSILSIK
jgi:V/A-type H+-transporting ATPase subunit C